jgi:hypothetical protein
MEDDKTYWKSYVNPDNAVDPVDDAYKISFFAGVGSPSNYDYFPLGPVGPAFFLTAAEQNDAVGMAVDPQAGWVLRYYPQDGSSSPPKVGESFVFLNDGVGFGLYAQGYGIAYRPEGSDLYLYPKHDETQHSYTEAVSVARNFADDEVQMAPWVGGGSALSMQIGGLRLATAEPGSPQEGQCRLNFSVRFKCVAESCVGPDPTINVRAATVGGTDDPGPVGWVSPVAQSPRQYNINVPQGDVAGVSIRDKAADVVIATSHDAPTAHAATTHTVAMEIHVGLNQFRNILTALAAKAGTDPASYYGSDWSQASTWKVKGVAVRMEVTPYDTSPARCGGSFMKFRMERI